MAISLLSALSSQQPFYYNVWTRESLPRDYLFAEAKQDLLQWLERSIEVNRRLIDHPCWDVRRVFPLYLIMFFVHPDMTMEAQLEQDREKLMFELCLIADEITRHE